MKKKHIRNILLATAGFLTILLIGAVSFRSYNAHRFHVEKQTRFMMDTVVTIYAVGPAEKGALALREAFERMQAVDSKFSTQNPAGAIYAFNHHNQPISDPEIVALVAKAIEIAQLTGGAFDITIEPLIELWGFYGDTPSLPETAAIEACLRNTGFEHLRIADGALQKDRPEIKIDLGGIAKGYAIGQAVQALKSQGIASALIDAGGDIFALGRRGRDLWKIGIRNPRGEDLIGVVEVENMAVMGSGDYQRFFIENETRYHHIFNPATGFPARGLSGTTLLHPDPMIADAWNTAIFVLGAEKGPRLVEQIPDMEAVLINDSGQIMYTSGLSKALSDDSHTKQIDTRRLQ